MTGQRFSFPAMGCTVDVEVVGGHLGLCAVAKRLLGHLEQAWSRFLPTSELVALNTAAGRGPFAASPALRDAVDAALALWRATDGLFDPTTIAALEWWGYDHTFAEIRRNGVRAHPGDTPAVPGAAGIIVDHERGTITVPAGVRVDLGGVGKGLAADALANLLVDEGASAACVSVGGDVAVAGAADDAGWVVPVHDPAHGNRVSWNVPMTVGALVQSNRVVRSWERNGEVCHHIIDPRTARPAASGVLGVVVRSDRAWWAEGVAKAALVAGPVGGAALLRRLVPAAWMILEDGRVVLVGDIITEAAA